MYANLSTRDRVRTVVPNMDHQTAYLIFGGGNCRKQEFPELWIRCFQNLVESTQTSIVFTSKMPRKSDYTLYIENLSRNTRSRDIRNVMEKYGPVIEVERDIKHRVALVEFESSRDAKDAWKRLDRYEFDGRVWRVHHADVEDFKFFGWRWTEGSRSPSQSPFPDD